MKKNDVKIGQVCGRSKINIEWEQHSNYYQDKSKLVVILTNPYKVGRDRYFVKVFCLSDHEIREIYVNRLEFKANVETLPEYIRENYEKALKSLEISINTA